MPDRPSPTMLHRAEYYALRAIVGVLHALPWEDACRFGAWLGALGYAPFGIRKHVVKRQIAAAFPEMPLDEVYALARRSYAHLGRSTVETALLPSGGKRRVLDLVESADDFTLVENAAAEGRGVIMVTGHLGNWELSAAYVAARGIPLDVIVRRQANPLFDAYLNETRAAIGMRVVYDHDAVRQTPRALRQGRAIGFVSDQGVLGLASTYVPFFGRPAKTPRGAAVFALKYNVPTFFVAALRQPTGKYRIVTEPIPILDTGNRDHDTDAIVACYTKILERWARIVPEQYFWQHRRWRRQPQDTPIELRDPTMTPLSERRGGHLPPRGSVV